MEESNKQTSLKNTKRHKNIVGSRIREARNYQTPKLSQNDLVALLEAYGLKLNQSNISKIESGERPVYDYELKVLGEALAVKVGWLIEEEEL